MLTPVPKNNTLKNPFGIDFAVVIEVIVVVVVVVVVVVALVVVMLSSLKSCKVVYCPHVR